MSFRAAAPAPRRLLAPIAFAALLILGSAGPAEAQILNTLRGWPASAPGWAGSLSAAGSLTGGTTREAAIEGSARIQYVAAEERFRFSCSSSRKDADGRKNKDEVVATGMLEYEKLRGEDGFAQVARLSAFLSGEVAIAATASLEATLFFQPRFDDA